MLIWNSVAWAWPHLVLRVGEILGVGLVILLTFLITRWAVRRNIISMLPEQARQQVEHWKEIAEKYRAAYEDAVLKEEAQRAQVSKLIGASAAVLAQLREEPRIMEQKPMMRRVK